MSQEVVTVIFRAPMRKINVDVEIPLSITANDLVIALNEGYNLEIDTSDIKNCFLKVEQPISLLRGNKSLKDFGVRNGSIIIYSE